MTITGGFGMMMDLTRGGTMRRWVIGRDGVKRWLDTGAPTEPACDRSACGNLAIPAQKAQPQPSGD